MIDEDTSVSRSETCRELMAVQLRKGFWRTVCAAGLHEPVYTSDIIRKLRDAELVVVEGTIYPLLSRLQRDGLLCHEWQESEQGHRAYYAADHRRVVR